MLEFLRRFLRAILDALGRAPPQPPLPPPAGCPIGWQPSVMAPVFYGVRDYGSADGAPTNARVFFPSLDGAVFDAPILEGCGRCPLIVFAHGHCSEPDSDHYQKWFELPSLLARSGSVVVVPALPATAGGTYPWENNAELALLRDVIGWMRSDWEHAGLLLPPPATGAIGHSYGALLAARLATELPLAAYASLSGPWSEWPSVPPRPVRLLLAPRLFTWGDGLGDVLAQFDGGWAGLPTIKHKAVLADSGHWDYLPAGRSTCESQRGSCNVSWAIVADITCTFFGKYLPPESWPALGTQIPDSLVPPGRSLTQEQQFFAGGHLMAFDLIEDRTECGVTLTWEIGSSSGTVTRP
jgi:pimeloyl-ACP methyl ester carboxylesterase